MVYAACSTTVWAVSAPPRAYEATPKWAPNELAVAVQGLFGLDIQGGIDRQMQLLTEIGANLARDVGQ